MPPDISAVFLTVSPMSFTASILMPARVVPTFTLEQTRSVLERASGIAAMSRLSPSVKPFCTRAEKPPRKFTPVSFAALSGKKQG